jgi:hypothetical protein
MRFLSLDQITFRLPVPIGAVLRLSSKVVYTTEGSADEQGGGAKVHIMVRAEVQEVETGVSDGVLLNLCISLMSFCQAAARDQYVFVHHDHRGW